MPYKIVTNINDEEVCNTKINTNFLDNNDNNTFADLIKSNNLSGQCSNCNSTITITENEIVNQDYVEKDCPSCGWSNQIEIDYDIDDKITGIHIF